MKIIDSFEKQASGVERVDEITKHDGTKVPIYLINSFHKTAFMEMCIYGVKLYYIQGILSPLYLGHLVEIVSPTTANDFTTIITVKILRLKQLQLLMA